MTRRSRGSGGNRKGKLLVALVISVSWLVPVTRAQESNDDLVVESRRLKLVLREDLRGIARLIDKRNGRDYCVDTQRSFGLYALFFGKDYRNTVKSRASNVVTKELTRTEGGVRVRFDQRGSHPALVDCFFAAHADQPEIRLKIDVTNRSNQPLVAVEFPRLTCRTPLGEQSLDDRILYPQHEGILLCDPARNMPEDGAAVAKPYPGHASAQFLYYFDPHGGLYTAAEDTQGHSKLLQVGRSDDGLNITWRHERPAVQLVRTRLEYDIVLAASGSTWQDGADLSQRLAERGDHMHVFTSGFRWGVRKTVTSPSPDPVPNQSSVQLGYRRDRRQPAQYQPRRYTAYNGLSDFRMGAGHHMSVAGSSGSPIREQPSAELVMLRDAAGLVQRCRDYLLLGRMLHDPVVKGIPELDPMDVGSRPSLPAPWPVIQATAWRSNDDNVCYALANLSDSHRQFQLLVQRNGMRPAKVQLTRIDAQGEQLLRAATALPIRITLSLAPWEICCVEQRLADRDGAADGR